MEVKLYNRNLTSPQLEADLTTRNQKLQFSTKLNGGFNICRFQLRADLPDAWEWIRDKVFYRLVITDNTKTLFEGRIEDVGLNFGSPDVTAYGYYANLSDIPYYNSYNDVASEIIKVVLTANCSQISSDQTNIQATDITINSTAGSDYLDKAPMQLFEKLLGFSDSTNGKWYFGIWEDRKPYLIKRTISSVTWRVSIKDFTRFTLKHRGGELYNRVYAIYTSSGVLTRTALANDTDSQEKYGDGTNDLIRSYGIPNLGEIGATAAQSSRDAWLAEHKDVWPRMTNMVLGGWVYDTYGRRYPSSWVRAGDVLRITDLVPSSLDLDNVIRDALRTFYIVETNYSVGSSTLEITPDTESSTLSSILAKKLG